MRVVLLNAGLSTVVFSLAYHTFFWIISFVSPCDLILPGYPLPSRFVYTFSLMTLLLFVTGIYLRPRFMVEYHHDCSTSSCLCRMNQTLKSGGQGQKLKAQTSQHGSHLRLAVVVTYLRFRGGSTSPRSWRVDNYQGKTRYFNITL